MNEENKNRYILVVTVVLLLVSVMVVGVGLALNGKSKTKELPKIELKQIYSSEYDLKTLNDAFYIGMYEDNLSVIIDNVGLEVFVSDYDIPFDHFYKMTNGNYLFYNFDDNYLSTFVFNGSQLSQSYAFNALGKVDPILLNIGNENNLLGFAYNYEDKLYILNIYDGTSVILNNVYLENYVVNNNYLIVKNDENKYGVIDLKGNLVIPYEYDNIQGTLNNTFIVSVGNQSFVLDEFGNSIGDKYTTIYGFKDYYIVLNNKGKMALCDINMNLVTKFEMEYVNGSIIDLYLSDEIILIKLDGKFYVIDDNVNEVRGTLYKINNTFMYYSDSIFYVLDADMNVVDEISVREGYELSKVTAKNNFIKLTLKNEEEEIYEYFNTHMEKLEAKDNLVYTHNNYYVYLNNKDDIKELVITDIHNVVITTITGVNISLNKDYVVVDKSIYKIVAE